MDEVWREVGYGWAAAAVLWVIVVVAYGCEPKEVKVVKQPMELSDAAKVVQALEPVIDKRWQVPLCLLAGDFGNSGKVVIRVPCEMLYGRKAVVDDKINRVVTHQTLYPPEHQPAEKPPTLRVQDTLDGSAD